MSGISVIEIPEKCSISAIYKAATVAAGFSADDVENWDCTKIIVSADIYNAYKAYMVSEGQELSVGSMWLICGPKTSDKLHGGEVEIQDGFIQMKSGRKGET